MSVAPPPAIYTATNDLNIIKNIFVPQYQFSNGYFHASVNTQLPGNVTVGNATTNFLVTVNNRLVMTLSDLQNWSYFFATSNVILNSNSITTVSKLTFLGGNTTSSYMIDATTGTINVSQYSLKSVPITLSGGLPAWAAYPASGTVLMNSNTLSGTQAIVMASGASITNPIQGAIAFSGASGETMRLNQTGMLGIGTTTALPAGYGLDVSGASMFSSLIRLVTSDTAGPNSNSFFIQTVSSGSSNYDVRMGTLGAATNLFICTGTPDTFGGPFGNRNQIKIDNVGNVTLSYGGITTPVSPAIPNSIGGVQLQNSTVTALLTISIGEFSTIALSSATRATTFIVTPSSAFSTINLTLPGATVSRGTYWVVKNATGSNQTISATGGTLTGLPTLVSNALTTIVYSGTPSNYYAL